MFIYNENLRNRTEGVVIVIACLFAIAAAFDLGVFS